MHLTRRQFGILLGIGPATLSPAMAVAHRDGIVERRVYEKAGAVPPASLLERCGMTILQRKQTATQIELIVLFPSLEMRVRAWDRFNSNPEWCALREGREVRLVGMTIDTASRTTG